MPEIKHKKFSLSRVLAVAARVLKQFIRDKRTLAMMLIFPIMFMLVFGIVLSGEVNNVPIIIENADLGFTHPMTGDTRTLGNEIFDKMALDDHVKVSPGVYSDGIEEVEKAKLVASILFPANFTEEMLATGNATILIYIDGTKPQLTATVYKALAEAMEEIMEGRGIQFEEQLAFGVGELSGLDVSIPGVMGYILTFLILLVAVLTAIREDINKTKFRLFTTPLTPVERILGYGLALSFFAMLETGMVVGIAIYIFGSVVQGSIILLLIAGFLYGIAHIFLAFFLSNFAKNEFQSVQLAILIAIPSLALSGMMVPVSTFPGWLATVSMFIPLTYGIKTFEGIMLRGWGLEELWFEFILIAGLAIVFFILALISSSDRSKA